MTTETTAPAPRWYKAAEVAKMIRAQLKRDMPDTRFRVITEHGSSVRVEWTDGPTPDAVDALVGPYAGKRFDGMWDLEYHARPWYCPEHGARVAETFGHSFAAEARAGHGNGPVDSRCCSEATLMRSGAGYVFTTRTLSDEFRGELEAQIAREEGRPYDGNTFLGNGVYMSDLVYRLSRKTAR